jgi:hypothetical protein
MLSNACHIVMSDMLIAPLPTLMPTQYYHLSVPL